MSNQIYDTIIIGGGPAGLTAGLYNGRAGMKTLVIESPTVIGQVAITADVENYPGFESISGPELIKKFRDQAIKWNAEIVSGNVNNLEKTKKGWKVFADDKVYESLAVIIATGAVPRKLNIPGEDKFIGRGVSYCATCDGPFYKGKEIVAIGGGDTAAEEAVF
ncbi:FAD-dependent oxidoreductase, partial [bacterium]|nr:FAD-dependent oxidoreductase [bacterium]